MHTITGIGSKMQVLCFLFINFISCKKTGFWNLKSSKIQAKLEASGASLSVRQRPCGATPLTQRLVLGLGVHMWCNETKSTPNHIMKVTIAM
jgi:hypothetical protein